MPMIVGTKSMCPTGLTIRVTAPVEAFAYLAEQVQPGFAVGIGKIDILAEVTERSDVV
jgi:hypothetical protein